jgi:hypothetical protein
MYIMANRERLKSHIKFIIKYLKISIVLISISFLFLFIYGDLKKTHPAPRRINLLKNQIIGVFSDTRKTIHEIFFRLEKTSGLFFCLEPAIPKIHLVLNKKNGSIFKYQLENHQVDAWAGMNKMGGLAENEWIKGNLFFENLKVDAKIKSKGDRLIHRDIQKPSIRLKLNQEVPSLPIWFDLQNPVIRNGISENLWLSICKNEGLLVPEHRHIKLGINEKDYGIYDLYENIGVDFLERNNQKAGVILELDELFGFDFNTSSRAIHVIDEFKLPLKAKIKAVDTWINFVSGKQPLDQTFDINKLGIFYASIALCQTLHGSALKSMRLYFNPYKELFEPIPYDGHYGTITHFTMPHELVNNNSWISKSDSLFFHLVFNKKNENFLKEYYKHCVRFSTVAYVNSTIKKVGSNLDQLQKNLDYYLIGEDQIWQEGIKPSVIQWRKLLIENRTKLENSLNLLDYTLFWLPSEKNPNIYSLHLGSDSIFLFPFDSIILNLPKSKMRICGTGVHSSRNRTNSLYRVSDLADVAAVNQKGQAYLWIGSIKKQIAYKTYFPFYKQKKSVDYIQNKFTRSNFDFQNNDTFVISNFLLVDIQDTLSLSGKTLIFKGLSGIKFSKGFLQLNDVQFISDSNVGFVSIDSCSVTMRDVLFKKLGSLSIVSLLDASCLVFNSIIRGSRVRFENCVAEDNLNIVNSTAILGNFSFLNASADAFDSDFSKGSIDSLFFENVGNDGFDVSGSDYKVRYISGIRCKDKVVSVGENSRIKVSHLYSYQSSISVNNKDGSSLLLDTLFSRKSPVLLAVFRKKRRFGNPITRINYQNSFGKLLIEEGINVHLGSKILAGNIADVEGLLYGSMFGVKSIR